MILHILNERDSFSDSRREGESTFFLHTDFRLEDYDAAIIESFTKVNVGESLKAVLRKRRKNLFGTKSIREIMIVQRKGLSGGSLTSLTQKGEEKMAIDIFKDILLLMAK